MDFYDFFACQGAENDAMIIFMRKMLNLYIILSVISLLGFGSLTVCVADEGLVIVDGDSLEIRGERIRLQGIDAPEFLQKCYDANGWKFRCGHEALTYLKKLTQGGVSCDRYGKDKYGRSLTECFTKSGININREMVKQGWAVAYGGSYLAEERQAKAAKRGIWRGKFMRPELYRALKRRK